MASVRYWAAARDASGTAGEQIEGASLGAILDRIGALHGPAMARLVVLSVVLVDGVQTSGDSDPRVTAETVIEILPPYAGG